MKISCQILVVLLLLQLQCQPFLCLTRSYDFFYFVQMWPGSYCDTKRGFCNPTTGKPAANFTIHGLWPRTNDGYFPGNCNPNSPYDQTKISDLIGRMQKYWPTFLCAKKGARKFWSHERNKHGTCSESVLDVHTYFAAALNLKDKVDLLQIPKSAGIEPDGKFYGLEDIKKAIEARIGHTPVIGCNADASGNIQLYQIYLCVDITGSKLIDCPVILKRKCNSTIEFPVF